MSLQDKINNSIKIIQENDINDYVCAFSGGKDSIVLYDLVKKSGVKYRVIFNKTTVDPLELLNFIKENYTEVEWIKPKKSMFQLIAEKGLPTRLHRWCCEYLKHNSFTENTMLIGIRAEESFKRSQRKEVELNRNSKTEKKIISPILNWTSKEIWEYIKINNLKYPDLYKKQKRIGCILCPMQTQRTMIQDIENYPKFLKAYENACNQYLLNQLNKGKKVDFIDGRDMLSWWISSQSVARYKENPICFMNLVNRQKKKEKSKLF